jgi:NAD(P)-dependent dehydrogenase (short-subunit alcohol dehydrogenase family)
MLSGKTALITGGGRGIGRATALLFAKNGANVVVCSKTRGEVDETAKLISSDGGRATALECDVSNENDVTRMFAEVKNKFGGLDILVNNAGVFALNLVENATLAEFNRVQSVNSGGVFLCCREAFKLMKAGGGSIVNVSSLSGVKGAKKFPGFAAYCASKFAVVGLTEALAEEGKKHGIRVNVVCPGAVDTVMLDTAFPNVQPRLSPGQVAEAILFLASPRSSAISGVSLELPSDMLPK